MSLVRGVNVHDGEGVPIRSDDNALFTHDFLLLVAEGKIPGRRIVHLFGRNPTVGTVSFETLWHGGGNYTGFNATAAETVTVVSSSVNDTLLGTGLRTIRLYGLDAGFNEITEDIEMTGTAPVTSQLSYIRLGDCKGLTTGGGTFGANLGDITVAQSITTANIFAVMPIGYNSTMIAAYTIPEGKTGYMLTQAASISNKNAAAVELRLKAKLPGTAFTVNGEAALNSQGTGFIERKFTAPGRMPAKTDVFIEAEASTTVAVAGYMDILLVDNPV